MLVQHGPTETNIIGPCQPRLTRCICLALPDNHADGCETTGIVQITPAVPATAQPALRTRAMPSETLSAGAKPLSLSRHDSHSTSTLLDRGLLKVVKDAASECPAQAFSSGVILRAMLSA
jgi:hypothetical protein